MWPQKWKASACCARSAAATTPPPLTASRSRPARARKPRREVAPATLSLNTQRAGRVGEEAFELEERVEGALREHLAVRGQDERVRAAGDVQRAPGFCVGLLVEELELDLRVGGNQSQRGLERLAQRTPGRGEDGHAEGCRALEALDQLEPAADRRPFVLQRERTLGRDRQPQLTQLAGEREHGHSE